MRRRRVSNNAISLFAFQDIITGTAGVMLFILMLLVVQLAISVPTTGPKRTSAALSAASVTEEPIVTADMIRDLQSRIEELTRLAIAAARKNEGSIMRETATLNAELNRLQQAASNKSRDRDAKKELVRLKAAERAEKLRSAKERIKELESELREIENRPVVNFTVDEAKSGLFLVDIQDGVIEILEPAPLPKLRDPDPLASSKPPQERRKKTITYRKSDNAETIVREIREAVQSLIDPTKSRFDTKCLVILRPAAAGIGNQVVQELTNTPSWQVSLELLEKDTEVGFWARVQRVTEE